MPRSRDEILSEMDTNACQVIKYEPSIASQKLAENQMIIAEILLDIRDLLGARSHETH